MIAELIAGIIVVLVSFTPGVLLSFALLHGVALSKTEKFLLGLVLGVIAAPALCMLEFTLFRVLFNSMLFFANSLLVAVVALALLWKQKQLQLAGLSLALPKPALSKEGLESWVKENWVIAIIVAVTLLGFYFRFAGSWTTSFFEFDPYYYDKLTEKLVKKGFIEVFSSESYYPEKAFTRWAPLIHYWIGSWYSLYQSILGLSYSKELLILFSQLYPPFLGALLSFLAFILVREEYNKYLALIPALLFAFTPQLIKKLAAGVSEQQPYGLFAVLLLLALLILAVNRKSLRLALFAAVAAFASIAGSQQFIWPFAVVAAYVFIQAVLDFLAGEADEKLFLVNAIVVAGAVVGNVFMYFYQEGANTPFVTPTVLLMVASLAFSGLLLGLTRFTRITLMRERVGWLAGVLAVALLVAFVTPVWTGVERIFSSATSYAVAGTALGKTIQEEGATSPSYFASAFGVLHPPTLLLLATLASVALMAVVLLSKKKIYWTATSIVLVAILVFFNTRIDGVIIWLAEGIGSQAFGDAAKFFVENDVFLYLLIALAASAVTYFYSEKKSKVTILLLLLLYPIAYIGLNKVKYVVHLAFALCLAAAYALGEASRAFDNLTEWLKLDAKFVSRASLVGLMLVGLVVAGAQAQTIGESMRELSYTRIHPDWIEAYDWVKLNLPQNARVMSWWDYGHWTTFFGERATVLDPNNAFARFNQGVAQAFVNGELEDLYYLMNFHKATHVLVDADLVSKWGALVFLSGSCDKSLSPVCPEKPEIDFREGPGKSKYEAEHYYEYLSVVGQCPLSVSPVPLPALSSNFGATYCFGKDEYFVLTREGLAPEFKRRYKIVGRDEIRELEQNVSYLFTSGENTFINVNPDLSYGGLKNNVFNAAFTQLFFFEQLPGFKLVHRSPNGMVKIFEYVGSPASAST